MKYIIYCRRSQDREDRQVQSIETQKKILSTKAKELKLDVIEIICEDASAYKRGRLKFKYLVEKIEKGEANAILVWHLTRLARNASDGGLLISLMDEGCIEKITTPERSYTNNSDDKFLMSIHFAMAKKSSDDTSSFVKDNSKTKIEKGEPLGPVPYGYLNIDKDGIITRKRFDKTKQSLLEEMGRPLARVEKDPIDAPIIQKLFQLARTGVYSLSMLKSEAERLGLKSRYHGKQLSVSTIHGLLKNPFYIGSFIYKNEVHQGKHEPLITKKEFEMVQKIIESRTTNYKSDKNSYTYSGLVFCKDCGQYLTGDFHKNLHYYRYISSKRAKQVCPNRLYLRQDEIDNEVEKLLDKIILPKSVIKWGLKYLNKIYAHELKVIESANINIQKSITEEKNKLKRLKNKWLSAENAKGTILSDLEYKEEKEILLHSIETLQTSLQGKEVEQQSWLDKCELFMNHLKNASKEYNMMNTTHKKILLSSLGAKITRTGSKVTIDVQKPFSSIIKANLKNQYTRTAKKPVISIKKPSFEGSHSIWLPCLEDIRTFFISNDSIKLIVN